MQDVFTSDFVCLVTKVSCGASLNMTLTCGTYSVILVTSKIALYDIPLFHMM